MIGVSGKLKFCLLNYIPHGSAEVTRARPAISGAP